MKTKGKFYVLYDLDKGYIGDWNTITENIIFATKFSSLRAAKSFRQRYTSKESTRIYRINYVFDREMM